MAKQRKDIPASVQKTLLLRACNTCAICKQLLTRKEEVSDLFGHFAEFAHIYPAEPNGPRHEEATRDNISEEFLYSYANIVILCPSCHTLVDITCINDYPTKKLFEIKKQHEMDMTALIEQKTAQMTFAELEVVCKAIIGRNYILNSDNSFSTIQIEEKIKKNNLSDTVKNLISTGLLAATTIENYLNNQPDPNFTTRLVAEFQKRYITLKTQYNGDELYNELMCDVAPSTNFTDMAATNAVISYLFHTCQVFEIS